MSARLLHLPIPTAARAPVAIADPSSPVSPAVQEAARLRLPIPCAAETVARWGAPPTVSPLPPATLGEARALRDALAGLLGRERHAAADFLLALSEFDRCRGWSPLGYSGLFTFLVGELGLSKGAAYVRCSAAGLLPAFPSVEAALRDGKLCLSTAGEVARVLRPENEATFLPRFFGLSAREAKELVAELLPRKDVPTREVVSTLAPEVGRVRTYEPAGHEHGTFFGSAGPVVDGSAMVGSGSRPPPGPPAPGEGAGSVGGSAAATLELTAQPRAASSGAVSATAGSTTIEPLTAELRRLHITVSRRFLRKVEAARDGLAHAIPGASMEQVLEAALDLLLERQASRRGLVKRPRLPAAPAAGSRDAAAADTSADGSVGARVTDALTAGPAASGAGSSDALGSAAHVASREPDEPAATAGPERPAEPSRSQQLEPLVGAAPSGSGRGGRDGTTGAATGGSAFGGSEAGGSRYIPAAIRREVWTRDRARCQHPLDSGGTCGATARLELDHLVPLALGGQSTAANLRVVCAFHNRAAARAVLGDAFVENQRARAQRRR